MNLSTSSAAASAMATIMGISQGLRKEQKEESLSRRSHRQEATMNSNPTPPTHPIVATTSSTQQKTSAVTSSAAAMTALMEFSNHHGTSTTIREATLSTSSSQWRLSLSSAHQAHKARTNASSHSSRQNVNRNNNNNNKSSSTTSAIATSAAMTALLQFSDQLGTTTRETCHNSIEPEAIPENPLTESLTTFTMQSSQGGEKRPEDEDENDEDGDDEEEENEAELRKQRFCSAFQAALHETTTAAATTTTTTRVLEQQPDETPSSSSIALQSQGNVYIHAKSKRRKAEVLAETLPLEAELPFPASTMKRPYRKQHRHNEASRLVNQRATLQDKQRDDTKLAAIKKEPHLQNYSRNTEHNSQNVQLQHTNDNSMPAAEEETLVVPIAVMSSESDRAMASTMDQVPPHDSYHNNNDDGTAIPATHLFVC